MTQTPTREACQIENCDSNEQQDYRVLQLWLADPHGRFDVRSSNFDRVRSSLEFMLGRLLRKSNETRIHEFWCDGVEIVEHVATADRFQFAGACIISDKEANTMWLAPFELSIEYREFEEWPSAAMVRVGHADASCTFDRSLPCSREHRLFALSHWIYGERPRSLSEWAISVELDPYPPST